MASEATGASGLAGRYAAALFELADEQKALDQTARDLSALKQALAESSDLDRLVRSPIYRRADQAKAIDAVAEHLGLSVLVRRFVALVAQNRRLFVLTSIIDAYMAQLARRRGEITAQVFAAKQLSDAQVQALTETLRTSVGSHIAVRIDVDPALIGGLVVKVGSRLIDNSVRTKLQKLQFAMKGVG